MQTVTPAKPISDRRLQSLEDRFCASPIGIGFDKFCDSIGLPESERIYLANHLELRYMPDSERRDALALLIEVAKEIANDKTVDLKIAERRMNLYFALNGLGEL